MRTTPVGQKWIVNFIDFEGEKSMGITDDYSNLPEMIKFILDTNGKNIVITDETIYKDDEDGRNEI